ncbi:SH3 domain-containing protein 3 [Zea mays]|uniref:SH3 domain-containing protein 3 n=1 Tax=Zea mays TaxID=4577 RepID=A0A3L6FPJ8_MAIZE|nr:SH3 domain-containing protein 3 [Zea mays]
MEALRKQASKFKEQVAKQQQAVIKQFSTTGYERSDSIVIDEVELQRHQQLEKLYTSTRSVRDFQKDIVRAAEGLVSIGNKHIEVGTKFSEDCYRYGSENNASDEALRKAASLYGGALRNIEKEYEDFNRILSSQAGNIGVMGIGECIFKDPLRAMAMGGPLEDARGLAQRYSRMRHEAEILSTEIARRKARVREAPIAEHTTKLQQSEARMIEHKASMAVLGKEAAAALAAVESQQQRVTLQRLVGAAEAEKLFHLRLAAILDDVEAEMSSEKQRRESAPPIISSHKRAEKAQYFLAEVKLSNA